MRATLSFFHFHGDLDKCEGLAERHGNRLLPRITSLPARTPWPRTVVKCQENGMSLGFGTGLHLGQGNKR